MRVEQGWEAMKEKSGKKTGKGKCAGSEREDIERWREKEKKSIGKGGLKASIHKPSVCEILRAHNILGI